MKRVHLIWDEFRPVLACDDLKCFFLFMKKELMMIFFGLMSIMICPLRIILFF